MARNAADADSNMRAAPIAARRVAEIPCQQGILQGILRILPFFRVFEVEIDSNIGRLEQNSLRSGAGNFSRPSREFFRLSRE